MHATELEIAFLLAHPFRAGRTLGQYEISELRGAVPNPNFGIIRKRNAELPENAAWIDHRA